ncbi:MAG: hypothetical protein ACRC7O_18295, partial [Fimbriiglobus sp.]
MPATWDIESGFSAASNPNGAWEYGWRESLESGFELSTTQLTYAGAPVWTGGSPEDPYEPGVWHNPTDSTITALSWNWPAGAVILHPGPTGQLAVVRFTAPEVGAYDIAATFTAADIYAGATTSYV